ncbi:MAG: competence protein ComEA helix-hairpin-helix repeat protein [Humibacillus sp.]|nr:competence protein ComEA helix-hairpin-helix repeat protein [Humibacillus sp.]
MPPRRHPPPPDLLRVARILDGRGATDAGAGVVGDIDGGGRGGDGGRRGWVPVLSGGDRAAAAPRPREPDPSPTELLETDLRRSRRPGLVTAPEPLRTGRWWVGAPTVVAFIALVVAVAGFFAVRVLWAERDSREGTTSTSQAGTGGDPRVVVSGAGASGASVPVAGAPASGRAGASGSSGTSGALGPAGRGSATAAGQGQQEGQQQGQAPVSATPVAALVVHVVGQVVRPGLVRLPVGSRVADAVTAAGGARSGADLSALNLARLLVDGEQLHVPRPGELVTPAPGSAGPPGATGGSAGGATSGGGGGVAAAPVSLNSADLSALDSLPGVGPVLAQRILDWRTEHGRFTSVDELGEVSGIGDKLLAQLRPRVTL